ncbi:MAG: hypothetical protein LBQ08_02235 [Holosporaceae bacterium]|nr:hypothetical protein [Holosporaceae bacterium]
MAVLFGLISAFLVFSSIFIPIQVTLFFSGLPIFCAYLAYGNSCGSIAFILVTTILFLIFPAETSFDIFLSMIAPAALLGHLSIKNIEHKNKIWWYPESFLLLHFVLLSFASVAFMSAVYYSEDALLKASNEAIKPLLTSNNLNVSSVQNYITSTIKYSVGVGMLIKMLATLLNFNLAHIITKKIKRNIRPEFNLSSIKINNFIAIFPLISLTIAQIFPSVSFLCSGLFVVGLFAPMLCGFSVVYRLLDIRARFIFSFTLLILTLPTLAVVIILGIIDSFYAIEKKASK